MYLYAHFPNILVQRSYHHDKRFRLVAPSVTSDVEALQPPPGKHRLTQSTCSFETHKEVSLKYQSKQIAKELFTVQCLLANQKPNWHFNWSEISEKGTEVEGGGGEGLDRRSSLSLTLFLLYNVRTQLNNTRREIKIKTATHLAIFLARLSCAALQET